MIKSGGVISINFFSFKEDDDMEELIGEQDKGNQKQRE
jgi:hypothetical protein